MRENKKQLRSGKKRENIGGDRKLMWSEWPSRGPVNGRRGKAARKGESQLFIFTLITS